MRPTGGHSPLYADRQDWTVLDEGQPVGRIYEDTSASTPDDLRWSWSITVYVWPDAGIATSGKAATRPNFGATGSRGRSRRFRRAVVNHDVVKMAALDRVKRA
jgi:hypothetical protein